MTNDYKKRFFFAISAVEWKMSLAIVIKVKIFFLLKNNDSQHVIFDCLELLLF